MTPSLYGSSIVRHEVVAWIDVVRATSNLFSHGVPFKRQDRDFNSSLVTGPEIRSKIRRTVPGEFRSPRRNTRIFPMDPMGNYGFGRQKLWFCSANGWVIS
ncbi:hypothetical protein K0M31_019345 [Melipona bicolor]|uniref:Uncharacterized protein n=1 Tax=Melipona bicolor TaxID=60889 RepID=A0AA40KR07_9HYME|nr:hypothetical protein K0M31_019345 [Melipona bicolor]